MTSPTITPLRRIDRVVFSGLALFGLVISGVHATDSPETPTAVVRATLSEMFRILEDETLKQPSQHPVRRKMLEAVVAGRFDYREISKRTLTVQWKALSEPERNEFMTLFRSFLTDRYADKIEGYAGEQVQYLSERLEGSYAEVRTKLVSSKTEIPMDYRLLLKGEQWYAYDIVIDGVSLVKNYRSQFEKIIYGDSYDELVRRLRTRTVGDDKKKGAEPAPFQ
jgi:phospholipid transport system substrate-binding protein